MTNKPRLKIRMSKGKAAQRYDRASFWAGVIWAITVAKNSDFLFGSDARMWVETIEFLHESLVDGVIPLEVSKIKNL